MLKYYVSSPSADQCSTQWITFGEIVKMAIHFKIIYFVIDSVLTFEDISATTRQQCNNIILQLIAATRESQEFIIYLKIFFFIVSDTFYCSRCCSVSSYQLWYRCTGGMKTGWKPSAQRPLSGTCWTWTSRGQSTAWLTSGEASRMTSK